MTMEMIMKMIYNNGLELRNKESQKFNARESRHMINYFLLDFKVEGAVWVAMHDFERLIMIPDLNPVRRRRPQSYDQKELIAAHKLNELGRRLSPRTSRKEDSPAETVMTTL